MSEAPVEGPGSIGPPDPSAASVGVGEPAPFAGEGLEARDPGHAEGPSEAQGPGDAQGPPEAPGLGDPQGPRQEPRTLGRDGVSSRVGVAATVRGPARGGSPAEEEQARRPRWPTVARAAAWVTAVVGVVVVMGVFIFPTRTWLQQRHQLAQTAQEVRILDQQNAVLAAAAAKLQTDAEVELLARERYQLVRPGDEVFAIGPAPAPPTTVPSSGAAAHPSGGVWHSLTAWLP